MFDLFGEALTTALFPCSLVLLVPGLAIATGSRHRSATATGAFLVGLLASSWLRFAGATDVWPSLITGVVFLFASLAVATDDKWSPALALGGAGAAAGAATGTLWRPCVGTEFGEVLNLIPSSGVSGGFGLGVYIAGVMAPVIALAAIVSAIPARWIIRASKHLKRFGSGALALLGIATIAGLEDRVIGRLLELSSF
jgi:cytochrome c biogenesis protein CcdA